MANKILQLTFDPGTTGLTVNAHPWVGGAAVNASPIALTEVALTPGLYQATLSDLFAGRGRFNVFQDGDPVGQWQAVLVEAAGHYDLVDPVLSDGFSDAALLSLRTSLTGAVVTVRGPVFGTGRCLEVTLTTGDDYANADGRAIEFDLDGTALPDLDGAIVDLVLVGALGRIIRQVKISGEITVLTGDTRTVRFEPTDEDTADLIPTVEGEFFVRIVTADLHVITPYESRGKLIILQGETTCS